MSAKTPYTPIPDQALVPTEARMGTVWDSEAIARLIRSKSNHGETPAFLFLGKKEAGLLRGHLAQAFGEEAVTTLKDTYYQGLEVITIEADSFVFAGGRKVRRTLQDPISRRLPWQERDTAGLWSLRL
ncbi:hypothetical protein [Luteolibacter sp. LG18]|uniref:hypothetical protein n=1 Tax=Luteolibacter sp. LG18 TaxID=2819286 RepID=UPI002B2A8BE7|nr:hypothetical protein llg_20290 [Luteolibacter sp. LG18]